jgi:hypothetical protein
MKRSPSSTVHASGDAHDGTSGAIAATSWLNERGLTPPTQERWHVEIALDVVNARAPSEFDDTTATRFHIDIYAEEWGVYACHAGRSSRIRVTDIAFVHGRDDLHLLALTPPLRDIAQLLRHVEATLGVRFQRAHASVTTNLPGIEPAIRAWLATF